MTEESLPTVPLSGKSAFIEAIRNGGAVEYLDDETNPLQSQWLRILDAQAACQFVAAVGDADIGQLPVRGMGAICKLVAQELAAIGNELDNANAEICRAVNDRSLFQAVKVRP